MPGAPTFCPTTDTHPPLPPPIVQPPVLQTRKLSQRGLPLMAKISPHSSIQAPRPFPVQPGSCCPMGLLLPPCPPRPLRQEPSQPLRESLIPVSRKETNSPLHLFHKPPNLIRFSSFLPVLGQSLLRAVENSFAPAVRKRLSPVRKIIKPSSHIRGNESPFLTQFAGRLFPLH